MTDLPPPLSTPECDLRGYEFMPMFGGRLFSSTFDAKATDAEFRAAVKLWWSSWADECPAGSLPNDDQVLCKAAGFGRDLKAWKAVRERALHGFIECSDGRLYHRLLADKAREAFIRRRKERDRKAGMRARKAGGQPSGQDEAVPRDNPGTDHVTTQGRPAPCPGAVFPGERRGEERIGEKKEKEVILVSPPTLKRAKARSSIPADWQPDQAGWEFASARDITLSVTVPKFRDYHIAKGSLMADWSAAWRTWCSNDAQFRRTPARAPSQPQADAWDWVNRLEQPPAIYDMETIQ